MGKLIATITTDDTGVVSSGLTPESDDITLTNTEGAEVQWELA